TGSRARWRRSAACSACSSERAGPLDQTVVLVDLELEVRLNGALGVGRQRAQRRLARYRQALVEAAQLLVDLGELGAQPVEAALGAEHGERQQHQKQPEHGQAGADHYPQDRAELL